MPKPLITLTIYLKNVRNVDVLGAIYPVVSYFVEDGGETISRYGLESLVTKIGRKERKSKLADAWNDFRKEARRIYAESLGVRERVGAPALAAQPAGVPQPAQTPVTVSTPAPAQTPSTAPAQ